MSKFRAGDFDKNLVLGVFRPFCPVQAVHSLFDINLDGLINRGKKLLMVDVDNTLVKWRSEEFTQETLDWIELAKSKGLHVCVISNTRNVERLARLSQVLGVPTMRGRFKPSRRMFRQALTQFHVKPGEAIMVGDQLFTDILGANRSGIEAVWLKPVSEVDFGPTKISRFGEKILKGVLYKALAEPIDAQPEAPAVEQAKPLLERTIVKQIIKFCIVGGTSFVIDVGLTFLFMKVIRVGGLPLSQVTGHWVLTSFPSLSGFFNSTEKAATPVLGGVASFVAMFNSFVWNRHWTFQIKDPKIRLKELRRFYEVSVIGAVLNTIFSTLFYNAFRGHSSAVLLLAKALAAVIVAVWNFTGQRFYAFKSS